MSIIPLPSSVGIKTGSATRTILLPSMVIDGSEFGHSSLHIALSRAGKEELPFSKSPCIRTSMHTIVLRACPITPPFMSSLTRNPRKSFYICFLWESLIMYYLFLLRLIEWTLEVCAREGSEDYWKALVCFVKLLDLWYHNILVLWGNLNYIAFSSNLEKIKWPKYSRTLLIWHTPRWTVHTMPYGRFMHYERSILM